MKIVTKELESRDAGQLLWKYSPAVASRVVASIYNVVNRIFITQGVSESGDMSVSKNKK